MYPESLLNLIEQFQKLPTIGRKSAERLAMHIIEEKIDDVKDFSDALIEVKEKIKKCKICGNISEDEICEICKNEYRDKSKILVVENVRSLYAIEKSDIYNGYYHVIGGLISPSDDVSASKLNIDSLVERIENGNVKELILAIPSTINGEMTSLFLKNLFKNYDLNITKLATGIPVGSDLEYFDQLTLKTALNDRRDVEDI
ncbi:MAG: recombination mediator RecR [Peptoniphilaceae bacterium]|nr:recombination mediator RecR [Peptoniphilaceae bacterium]MDD7383288.1 recombination mediator RecR [Peptoniphilaceae bacterium]MDY3738341.1 recombination mediator RecR [Peptoniphilaceae bacterium]